MGVSNNAILVYGVDIGESFELPEDVLESLENEHEGDIDNWFADLQKSDFPHLEITSYCSYEYPMYIVSIKDMRFSASRGNVRQIPQLDDPAPSRYNQLRLFCEKFNIEFSPGWLLNTMNG